MADNFTANAGAGGSTFAADDIVGVLYPRSKIAWGVDGAAVDASATNPLPVSVIGDTALTDAQLRAVAVPVSGTFWQATQPVSGAFYQATQPVSFTWSGLTDTQLRATPVPVSGTFFQATQPVSLATNTPTGAAGAALALDGTDITTPTAMPAGGVGIRGWLSAIWTKLNGTLGVTGTFWQATQPVSIAASVAVTGPLTDTQLRAAVVPVSLASTTVTGSVAVTGPLTDTQIRATALPVSGTFFQTTQPVSLATNTPTLQSGSTTTVTQATGTNLHVVVDSAPTTAVTGPLTDAQLRAAVVPVSLTSTTVTGTVAVTGALTDTQIRATALPVSAAAMTDGTQKTRITNGTTDSGIEPFGALQVNSGFTTLFYDSWSTSPIDTVDKWAVTGTAPTISGGNMVMPATVSTYNAIRTKDTVRPNAGYSLVRNGISVEAATATGAGRFWGLGTPATTPAAAVLAQDGIGFELDQATGALLAVSYAAGVRTTVATLTKPTDGATHAYGIYFRVTQAYWILDGVTVASGSFPNVLLVELPALIVRQNSSAFTGTPVFTNIAHLTADTSRQGFGLADPVIGTRMARVSADGALRVSTVNPAMVDSHSQQQIDGISLQQLVRLSVEQLRQTTKVALLLSTISGLIIEDDDIEPIIY